MKSKKLLSVCALATSCLLFASCGNTSSKMSFSANWYQDTTSKTISQNVETLVYSITPSYEGYTGLSEDYFKTTYSTGTYTTTLTPISYEGETIYQYTTRSEIGVSFFHKSTGESTQAFTDVVESTVLFTGIYNGGLRPIKSTKTIQSHTPINGTPANKDQCYVYYHYSVETTYDTDGNGTCVLTDFEGNILDKKRETQTNTFAIESQQYTYLDNEQVLFALRGAPTEANKFLCYNSSTNSVQTIKLSVASEEGATYKFSLNGENKELNIAAIPVSIEIDSINSGGPQKIWYAKTTDVKNNVYRNVMLKFETPIAYNIGKLVYTLTSATFA